MRVFRSSLLLAVVFSVFVQPAAFAAGERIEHYAAERPASAEAATALYKMSKARIAAVLDKKELSDSDLEAIHEQSYSLEAAVDAFRATNAYPPATIDTIDEAVQALHYASEHHETARTREWFARLEQASQTLN